MLVSGFGPRAAIDRSLADVVPHGIVSTELGHAGEPGRRHTRSNPAAMRGAARTINWWSTPSTTSDPLADRRDVRVSTHHFARL